MIKDYTKIYYQEHKEHIRKNCKKYYEEHKEVCIARSIKYAKEHKEETAAYKKKWCGENKKHCREVRIRYIESLKREVLTHYSDKGLACVSCGFKDMRALTIDHINESGGEHRRGVGCHTSIAFYVWLKKHNFPSGFQTLCSNCQLIKEIERRRRVANARVE